MYALLYARQAWAKTKFRRRMLGQSSVDIDVTRPVARIQQLGGRRISGNYLKRRPEEIFDIPKKLDSESLENVHQLKRLRLFRDVDLTFAV
jgi:hypothetical protein